LLFHFSHQPPGIDELRRRLKLRATESPESIESRIAKAAWEMSFVPRFDAVIVNGELHRAEAEILHLIKTFLGK
jgi:guanylate kinase